MKTDSRFKGMERDDSVMPPFIARLDGWSFHTFTKGFVKPYDERLWRVLEGTATSFFPVFKPAFAYMFSDEVSFVFSRPTLFDRVEKLDSLMAGFYSSAFSSMIGKRAVFDCRIVKVDEKDIAGYLAWRQADCRRNFVSGWAERSLSDAGLSPARIAKALKGVSSVRKEAVCRENGTDLDSLPSWQRSGAMLSYETYTKDGYNPVTQESVKAVRRRVVRSPDVPSFRSPEGEQFVGRLLALQ